MTTDDTAQALAAGYAIDIDTEEWADLKKMAAFWLLKDEIVAAIENADEYFNTESPGPNSLITAALAKITQITEGE